MWRRRLIEARIRSRIFQRSNANHLGIHALRAVLVELLRDRDHEFTVHQRLRIKGAALISRVHGLKELLQESRTFSCHWSRVINVEAVKLTIRASVNHKLPVEHWSSALCGLLLHFSNLDLVGSRRDTFKRFREVWINHAHFH